MFLLNSGRSGAILTSTHINVQDLKTLGVSVSRVDMQRPESWEAMVRPETKVFADSHSARAPS